MNGLEGRIVQLEDSFAIGEPTRLQVVVECDSAADIEMADHPEDWLTWDRQVADDLARQPPPSPTDFVRFATVSCVIEREARDRVQLARRN